jgi:hypothetical protein
MKKRSSTFLVLSLLVLARASADGKKETERRECRNGDERDFKHPG